MITAKGAPSKKYVQSLTVDGVAPDEPIITHAQISRGANIMFEMADSPQAWGSATITQSDDSSVRQPGKVEWVERAEL